MMVVVRLLHCDCFVKGRTEVSVRVDDSLGGCRSDCRQDRPSLSTERDLRPDCNTLELLPRAVLIAGNIG